MPDRGTTSTARRAVHLVLVSAVGRAPAFLIPVLIAAAFGSGERTDAYFLAYSAVLLFGGTLAQGVEQAIVPFAAGALARRVGVRGYLDHVARTCAVVALGAWAVSLLALTQITTLSLRRPVAIYALCFTPLAVAWCGAAVFSGALLSQWRIARSTGSMLLRGAGALLGLAVAPFAGLPAVALGLGTGELARVWWLRHGLLAGLGPEANGEPEAPPGLLRSTSAQVGASMAIGAAPLGERLLAMSLGVGAVSHLEYAVRLLSVASVPFDGALVPLALARWTSAVAQTGAVSRRDVFRVLRKGLGVALVIAAGLAFLAPALVRLILAHGRFSDADALAVSQVLRLLAVAYVPNMGASLIERHYIALMRNRTLATLSVVRVGTRLAVAWFCLGREGLLAFPIGFAASEMVYLMALLALVPKAQSAAQAA